MVVQPAIGSGRPERSELKRRPMGTGCIWRLPFLRIMTAVGLLLDKEAEQFDRPPYQGIPIAPSFLHLLRVDAGYDFGR
jgi:hypothetical protein